MPRNAAIRPHRQLIRVSLDEKLSMETALMNKRIKWKILIPMGAILVILVATITIASSVVFTRYSRNLLNERIAVAGNGMKEYISVSKENTRIAAIAAVADAEVINAVNSRDSKKITRLLGESLDLYHVDFFTVTDETGTVLVRTFSDVYGDSVLFHKGVREALKGNVYTGIDEGFIIKVAARTSVPAYDKDGVLIGVVIAGNRFDTNDALDTLKNHYDSDFAVYYNGIKIATTVVNNSGERVIGAPLGPQPAKYLDSFKEDFFGSADVEDENYSVFYMPILNEQGEVYTIFAAGISNNKMLQQRNAMRNTVAAFGLIGLIVSIAALLLLTTRIAKPIGKLSYLVSEVTNGNLDVEADRENITEDEIGSLTLDIFALVDMIKLTLSDLSRLTIGLDKFSDADIQIDASKYSGAYRDIIDGIKQLAYSISMMRKTMTVMDYLDSMISVVDFDYNLVYVNRSMADYAGIDRENCIGKKCYKELRNHDKPCDICQLPKLLPKKGSYPFIDYDGLYDENTCKYVGGRAAIIRWVDGGQMFFNSIKDETQKIEYQEKLRETSAAAKAASVAKSAFLANMSHEIRTPMNSIIGFSELALDSESISVTRDYVFQIKENAGWLLQIINDILDISKVESGKFKLETIPFSLREIISRCKKTVAQIACDKNINLYFHTDSSINKMLLGDPTRLVQVLINLMSNAVKFTDKGAVKLAVTILNETEDDITLRFTVLDTGIGMTAEQSIKILEPFVQADISTTRKYGGTGLGIPITKSILDQMGAKLEIESELGSGTKISFDLTLGTTEITPEVLAKSKTVEKLVKPMFKGDILACEDNHMNQRVIADHLDRVGLNVEIAENGLVGVEKVRERVEKRMKPYDLIFMDIHMPEMDGLEATGEILRICSKTPIVAMTANIMADDREQYEKAGMNGYLGKPFTSQELWSCLIKYLKPVAVSDGNAGKDDDDDYELRTQLKIDFVESNLNRFAEIKSAADVGEIKLAHRLAHSLKSTAGLIGRTALQEAAADVEAAFKSGENRATEDQMNILKSKLSEALDELNPYLIEQMTHVQPDDSNVEFDAKKTNDLLDELEPLLKSRDAECLKMIDRLVVIPGSGELIRQIEDYNFRAAAQELPALRLCSYGNSD